jgi:hypothetical protein
MSENDLTQIRSGFHSRLLLKICHRKANEALVTFSRPVFKSVWKHDPKTVSVTLNSIGRIKREASASIEVAAKGRDDKDSERSLA